jgi:hypothetical protein
VAETNNYAVGAPKDYLTHAEFPVDERVWLRPDDVAAGQDTVVEAAPAVAERAAASVSRACGGPVLRREHSGVTSSARSGRLSCGGGRDV